MALRQILPDRAFDTFLRTQFPPPRTLGQTAKVKILASSVRWRRPPLVRERRVEDLTFRILLLLRNAEGCGVPRHPSAVNAAHTLLEPAHHSVSISPFPRRKGG